MKVAICFIALLAGLWSAYWWGASAATGKTIREWMDARRAEGWAAEGRVSTTGFPGTFTTTLDGLRLVDPQTGVSWQADTVILDAAAWAPTDMIVTFPPQQVLASPFEKITIDSQLMKAGLGLTPGPNLPLETSQLTIDDLRLSSDAGWSAAAESISWQSAPGAAADSHQLRAEVSALALTPAIKRLIDPSALLPDTIQAMRLEGTFSFDAPWGINALQHARPQPTRINLNHVEAIWGGLELRIAGDFAVDANGIPEGTLDIRAVNWQDMIALLEANGSLPSDIGPLAKRALKALAAASGRPDTLDAPLTLSGGFIRFGPIPIGPVPRLRIR